MSSVPPVLEGVTHCRVTLLLVMSIALKLSGADGGAAIQTTELTTIKLSTSFSFYDKAVELNKKLIPYPKNTLNSSRKRFVGRT